MCTMEALSGLLEVGTKWINVLFYFTIFYEEGM